MKTHILQTLQSFSKALFPKYLRDSFSSFTFLPAGLVFATSNVALWFFSGINCALYDVFQISPLQTFLSAGSHIHTYHVVGRIRQITSPEASGGF